MSEIVPSQVRDLATLPLSQNPAAVYIASLESWRSRTTMQTALGVLADLLQPGRWIEPQPKDFADKSDYKAARATYSERCLSVDWSALRFQHTTAIKTELLRATFKAPDGQEKNYKVSTANKMLAALRGVLKMAWQLELMSAEDYMRAVNFKLAKGSSRPAGRDLSPGEILSLVNACQRDKNKASGARDAAIIGVLYICALRRSEAVDLNLADFNSVTGDLIVLHGKGNKERKTNLVNGALEAVRDWLVIRGDQSGPLFLPVNKGGNIQMKRLTSQAIYNMLAKRGDAAGLKKFSPHDFRRTFVGDMLARSVDIETVRQILGHASVVTTSRYDRRPDEVKRQAVEKLFFPYNTPEKVA